jgi:hypothetical protein
MNEPHKSCSNSATEMAEMTELVVHQIRELGELYEAAILTEEEFTAKKAELLARL